MVTERGVGVGMGGLGGGGGGKQGKRELILIDFVCLYKNPIIHFWLVSDQSFVRLYKNPIIHILACI